MDRRLEKRRREVAEGQARSGLGKLFVVLILALLGGLTAWIFRSPLLAVQDVVIAGAPPHLIEVVRVAAGIEPGQPMVAVRLSDVEAALSANPWIRSAEASLHWPHDVLIEITPRLPVAWLGEGGSWSLVGEDAVVLETAGQAGPGLPTLVVEGPAEGAKLGGLAFLSELGPLEYPGARVEQKGPEIWAEVSGYTIRLGRPIDMEAKARALAALLSRGVAPGAVISLVAPTRPALSWPQAQAQVEP